MGTITIGPEGASAAVILLHGLGDSGQGLSGLASGLQKSLPHVRWVFPTASTLPISVNGGSEMRAWFDINGFDEATHVEDAANIKKSAGRLLNLVEEQRAKGISRSRI